MASSTTLMRSDPPGAITPAPRFRAKMGASGKGAPTWSLAGTACAMTGAATFFGRRHLSRRNTQIS